MSMAEQFQQFINLFNLQHPGVDPKQVVQNMLNAGQMTQSQFEQCRREADELVKGVQYGNY